MKHLAVLFTLVATVTVALGLTGRVLFRSGLDLLPIPSIGRGSVALVVVDGPREQRKPPASVAPSPTASAGTATTASEPILTAAPSQPVTTASPDSGSPPAGVPSILNGRAGYVRNGRVVLELGWTARTGGETSVERRLATLADGECGVFDTWSTTDALAPLPPGSCALYRVLIDGNVAYTYPDPIRYDGTDPELPALDVTEESAREHVAGDVLYVAGGAADLRPVTISASASDAESGIANVTFSTDDEVVADPAPPYVRVVSPSPGALTVAAENGAGETTLETLQVVEDTDGPTGGSVVYPATPDAGGAVEIFATAGRDAGAGVDEASGILERRIAVLAKDGCGEYGEWKPARTPDARGEGTCSQYRFRVADNVGNETTYGSDVATAVPDGTMPRTVITDPGPGTSLSGTVAVRADAEDAGSGIRSVTFEASRVGSGTWASLGSVREAPYAVSWDTLSVEPGDYYVRSIAVDRGGNAAESELVQVSIAADTVAPTTAIVTPGDGATVSGTVRVAAEASDTDSGIASVTLQVRRGCGAWTDLATLSSAPFSASWDTSPFKPGRYRLRSLATDKRGNSSVSEAVTVEIQEPEDPPTPPESADDSPASDEPAEGDEEGSGPDATDEDRGEEAENGGSDASTSDGGADATPPASGDETEAEAGDTDESEPASTAGDPDDSTAPAEDDDGAAATTAETSVTQNEPPPNAEPGASRGSGEASTDAAPSD